ncbi:MAG: carboxy terminal-processing peptidase [Isosphaeraceae bacterium]|nr:carboxy terminal-processing peptidase [Isosphaeraceae bacterium]
MHRNALRVLSVVGMLAVGAAIVGAQAPGPDQARTEQLTARVVVQILEQVHMAHPKIDDATAKKWCDTFLEDLDPLKYVFLAADVDEFRADATKLDDMIKQGDISFAKRVFERYVKRSDERHAAAMKLLEEKPDFTIDESMSDDFDEMPWPKDEAEARERLRKRIKYQLLVDKVADKPEAKSLKTLGGYYRDRNRTVHQLTGDDLLELYLTSLMKTFDPHSNYMTKNTYEDFVNSALHLSLSGIGAQLAQEDGVPVVKELVPGGPADLDGRIQVEDKIVGLIKPDGEEESFLEKRLTDIVRKIRGEAGTKVKIVVQPADAQERKVYELTRAKIDLKEDRAKGDVVEKKVGDKTLRIGVIHLPTFYGDSAAALRGNPDAVSATEDCRKIIRGFEGKNVDCVVVDLRGNGGGLLNEAITLSGLFIDKGPVVQVRDAQQVKVYDDEENGAIWEGPMVVLIDRNSASASEIFAGVIKDYGRGLVIGDSSTFGKGTVQQMVPINEQFRFRAPNVPDFGALKLTIQQFYRANGESTQIRGVVPDIKLPNLFDQEEFGEGKLDNSLAFGKIEAVAHDNFNRAPADLIQSLVARSEERRGKNEKFRKLETAIEKFKARRAAHSVTLNEAKYRAEIASEEVEKKDKDAIAGEKPRAKRFADRPVWESNFYNDEVMDIVGDYLTLGSKILAANPVPAR